MGIIQIKQRAFTIVELLVIIVVIGILASISIVGYGAWQKRTVENVVKSDLGNAVSAMESARNFNNTYPGGLPASFSSSDKVVIAATSSTGTSYCVQASSTQDLTVIMYVTNTNTTPQYGNCYSSSGLVAWWPMNGSASDRSGNNINGAVSNTTLTAGRNGNANGAYSFNGSTSYIDGSTNTALAFTDDFTLSAWIKPTSYHTVGYFGLMNGIIARGPASTYNYALQVTNATTISFIKRTGAEGLQFNNFGGVPSLTNVWTLVTVTVKSGAVSLYINGSLLGTGSVGAIAGAANDQLSIGTAARGAQTECFFIGSIDDVRVYRRALLASEVAALYNANAQ